MAKSQVTLLDSNGNLITDATDVKWKIHGTETVVASMVGSDTGGSATVVSNGDGSYITDGDYSTYMSSGNLVTGTYDIEVGGNVEIDGWAHVNPADVTGALQASSNLSDVANAATARTNLGLAIGSDVQAYDSDITSAASWWAAWDANGATYPFAYYSTSGSQLAFTSASGMRTQLGLGTAAVEDADTFWNGEVSTSAPPTASSSYVGQFWIRNDSTVFAIYVCVRTGTSTYAWREVFIDDGAGGSEEAYYTYGGA